MIENKKNKLLEHIIDKKENMLTLFMLEMNKIPYTPHSIKTTYCKKHKSKQYQVGYWYKKVRNIL